MKTLNLWTFSATALLAMLDLSSAEAADYPETDSRSGYPTKTYSYSYPTGAYPARTPAPEPSESAKPFKKFFPGPHFRPNVPTVPDAPDYKKIDIDFPNVVIETDEPAKGIETDLPPFPFFGFDEPSPFTPDIFSGKDIDTRPAFEDLGKDFEDILKNLGPNLGPEYSAVDPGVFSRLPFYPGDYTKPTSVPAKEVKADKTTSTPKPAAKTTLVTVTSAPPARPSASYVYKYDNAV